MDIPRYLAEYLTVFSGGVKAEVEPSPADIKGDRFVVGVRNFWQEPRGTFGINTDTFYRFKDGAAYIEGYDQALPVRVIYRSHSSGEMWRGKFIEQARRNATLFSQPFRLPILGEGLSGRSLELATNGHGEDLPNPKEHGPGLGMIVMLERDPSEDVVFEKLDKNGYKAEQHFIGDVYFNGGDKMPPRTGDRS